LLAIGMAHGPVALAIGEMQLMRPQPGDEAGFSMTSADIDGQRAWIVGSPAANRILAVSQDDLSILREWNGTGRFGHAIAVADLDGDDREDLVVGAPFDGVSGNVVWFSNMSTTPSPLTIEAPDAQGIGTALVTDGSRLIVGAPGSPITAGQVIMVPLPL